MHSITNREPMRHYLVALSANCEEEIVKYIGLTGFDEFLAKPFSLKKFQDLMSQSLST